MANHLAGFNSSKQWIFTGHQLGLDRRLARWETADTVGRDV